MQNTNLMLRFKASVSNFEGLARSSKISRPPRHLSCRCLPTGADQSGILAGQALLIDLTEYAYTALQCLKQIERFAKHMRTAVWWCCWIIAEMILTLLVRKGGNFGACKVPSWLPPRRACQL